MGVGKRIRKVREDAGMKQRDFAFLLGATQAEVSKWEMEKQPVPYWVIHTIAEEFKIREIWLRVGDKPMKKTDKYRWMEQTVSREHCGGCYHYIQKGEYSHCDYIGHTQHCRPCRPGKGCTEYITEDEWRKTHAE